MRLSQRLRTLITLGILLTAVMSGYLWGSALRPSLLRITVLDVGQGDAAVLETPTGSALVVDAGRSSRDSSRGRSVVLPYLRSRGINRVSALVLTHWDQDHAGGAHAILLGIRTDRLILPIDGPWVRGATETEQRTKDLARRRRIPVVRVRCGAVIQPGGGVVLDVLNPPTEDQKPVPRSDNDASLVLMVRYGRTRVLLMGDADAEAEHRMVRGGPDVQADILKLGHHGSNSSTSDRWLNAVKPQVAIISVGQRNPFGHPDPRVLQRLSKRRIRVLRTDRHGAITIWSDGSTYRIKTQRFVRE